MTAKRKISVRKILQTIFTIACICCCIIALSSASNIEGTKTLSKVEIDISNGEKYRFLDDSKVMEMINHDYTTDVTQVPIGKLDIHNMEHTLVANPWVEDAQVYIDNDYILHLLITQRTPVMRIFESNGNSYYLDKTLNTVPLSPNYIHYTMVVTNVPPLKNDSTGTALKNQVLSVVKFIQSDPFWTAQISQIVIDSANTFALIPLLGSQRIMLGDTSSMKEKFDNLFVFYKKISNRIGWDKYSVLDLRYKGQVIASPALPWKGPIDKAMVNMNWARSMIDSNLKANKANIPDTAKAMAKPRPAIVPLAKKPVLKKVVDKHEKGNKKQQAHANDKGRNKKVVNKKEKKDKDKKHSPKYIYQKKNN